MKFCITMKDPDGVYDSIKDVAGEQNVLSEEELSSFAGKWLEYGEYVTIEFDTEAGTATVLKR